jgi:hypothetical protein
MTESRIDFAAPSTNGTVKTARKASKSKPQTTEKKQRGAFRAVRLAWRNLTGQRKIAVVLGSTACFVLALSLSHCTTALQVLLGCNGLLAFLFAVGIDCGLVASELSSIASPEGTQSKRWADRYVKLAVALSVLLNAFASALEPSEALARFADRLSVPSLAYILSALTGAVIPVCVYILARATGHKWRD